MTAPAGLRVDPFGRLVGLLVACSFGAVFIAVNVGELPGAWPTGLRVVGVATAVVLAIRAVLEFRLLVRRAAASGGSGDVAAGPGPGGRTAPRGFGRAYWIVVAVEAVALFGGLAVINGVLGLDDLGVAWVAVVVGLHFVGLAYVWRLRLFLPLGAVITGCGLAGFVAFALGASGAVIGVLAGVLSGVALLTVAALPPPQVDRAGTGPLR